MCMTTAPIGLSVASISPQMGWLSVVRPRDEWGVTVPQESDDDELTTGQAAKEAGVSRWKILRDAKSGKLPSRELPRSGSKEPDRRYRRGDVIAYRGPNAVDLVRMRSDLDELRERVERLEQERPEQP